MSRLSFYRFFFQVLIKLFSPILFLKKNIRPHRISLNIPLRLHSSPRFWFHAASAGELESLWSMIVEAVRHGSEVIVTIFSGSALPALQRLRLELEKEFGSQKLICFGFSPWEGDWDKALRRGRPTTFLTAKYEAWPELWCSLSTLHIPLVIVGAKKRFSLQFVKLVCCILGSSLPVLKLISNTEADLIELQKFFPQALVFNYPDPRWDRIWERVVQGNSRALEVVEQFKFFPRPWGMLGQIWLEDLLVWQSILKSYPGTIWIVPHRIDLENTRKIKDFLSRAQVPWVSPGVSCSPARPTPQNSCVFISEAGFLVELYRACDWVYVGGGFGQSIHNTMEPALYGVPISAGPAGQERFSEIGILRDIGQLTLVSDAKSIRAWLDEVHGLSAEQKENWQLKTQTFRGGTKKILSLLPLELS